MTIYEWIDELVSNNLLCKEYQKKFNDAQSKKQIMDIVLDANGVSFMQEMQSCGHAFPYNDILDQFGAYLNGRYVYHHGFGKYEYSSAMYCCYCGDNVVVSTTSVAVLGCCGTTFEIKDYDVAKLYVDSNSDITIKCNGHSKCYVDLWKGGKVSIEGDNNNVIITER